ncbi:AAA family ATPase [Vibrio parahaemolyticus]|uniref:AAA family ATPase n=1 Tax=Vibrio parahaemolyticus TaxID=670 RepID=UPI0021533DD0|nr:AAA family ATPase [Vibrio parahaemolyticus]
MEQIDNNINYWLVGASYGGGDDQTERFLQDGVWQNGYDDRYLEQVKQVKAGDRIAIKSAYVRTRSESLPFDNRGHPVSTMKIKAIGTVTKNHGDGQWLDVDWQPIDQEREWYFYTALKTIWKLNKSKDFAQRLIEFAFLGKPQDITKFRNDSYWAPRFGDQAVIDAMQFPWVGFYEQVASALLRFKDDRQPLLKGIFDIAEQTGLANYFGDKYANGENGLLQDICPFTVMGMFNRGIKDSSRTLLAQKLADFLSVDIVPPTQFNAIPTLNNINAWFFKYEKDRQPDDIDKLWEVFEAAINFADQDDEESRKEFASAFDQAATVANTKWNLTMGLFWVRPWSYPTLESNSRSLLAEKYNYRFNRANSLCTAQEYLDCITFLNDRFATDHDINSFPAFSYSTWATEPVIEVKEPEHPVYEVEPMSNAKNVIYYGPPGTGKTYLLQKLQAKYTSSPEVVDDSMWLQENIAPLNWMQVLVLSLLSLGKQAKVSDIVGSKYFQIKAKLNNRDNNLSQTAWSYLQKFTIADSTTVNYKGRSEPAVFDKSSDSVWHLVDNKLELVEDLVALFQELEQGPQAGTEIKRYTTTTFHQSYGYEEFIEGLKASTDEDGNVHYSIEAGEFLKLCRRAEQDPAHQYAIFIDEINRGNISKIFGELISLVEVNKRSQGKYPMSINLACSGKPFTVPSNVDIIGTMNTADRSLALMDTALRRRFEFIEMMPKPELLALNDGIKGIDLQKLLQVLNQRIEILYNREHTLGHAFFMPVKELVDAGEEEQAFSALVSVFQNKITPLLEEYFFEDCSKIRLVLADNQKKSQELQFVSEQVQNTQQLNDLFGNNHELEQYGQSITKYTLADKEADVWIKPESYIGIYTTLDSSAE